MRKKIFTNCLIGIFLQSFLLNAQATPNFHMVGWLNTVLPGGGQLVLGNYPQAALELSLELGTFIPGYMLSKRSPMTIDGVPEELPAINVGTIKKTSTKVTCIKVVGGKCKQFATSTSSSSTVVDRSAYSFVTPISASLLQEFGIKYHMVNVFNSYRRAIRDSDEAENQRVDQSTTGQLFLAPFRGRNLISPWVFVPLLAVAGLTVVDYRSQMHDPGGIQRMTPLSNGLYSFNYMMWQPFGSGAPEEMFYRGFLQNEFYNLVSSPFFSIPLSAAAFAFSHKPEGRIGAAVSGTYLGLLAHKNKGSLMQGIALHFWSVVMLGIETVLLARRAQGISAVPSFSMMFDF